MKEFELMQKVRAGEREAFEKWMDIYSGDIERFAVQFGCSLKQAGEVAEKTFRKLHIQLESFDNEASLVCALYKNVLNSLAFAQREIQENESILAFKEDQELHDQIVKLEMRIKVPFILSEFHKLDELEIAAIMDTSPEGVQQAITAAHNQLEDAQLEKRLEFLDKSYLRMRTSFRKEMVFQDLVKSSTEVRSDKKSITKKALFLWIGGVLLLVILFTISVVTSEEYKKSSDEKYLAHLNTSFENEMATKYMELGLVEPKGEMEVSYGDTYGQDERQQFEQLTKKLQKQLTNNEKINRENVQEQYEEIMGNLEYPSEMIAKLLKNPLTDDRAASEAFIKAYINKVNWVSDLYRFALFEHREVITEKLEYGTIDIEKLLLEKNTYPEEVREILEAIGDQNIGLFNDSGNKFFPIYVNNEVSLAIRDSIHEDFRGYMTFLESNSMNYWVDGSEFSLEETLNYIIELENTLLVDQQEDISYQNVLGFYNNLFYEGFIRNEDGRLTGSDGKLRKEYRSAWEKLANIGVNSPSAHIMQQIVKEMEESDWEKSDSLERLEYHHLYEAVGLAKRGDLHLFTFESVIPESGSEVAINDPEYIQEVETTYLKFSSGHQLSTLAGVEPLVVFGVYLYANEQEDPKTMWHLTNYESISLTEEEFITNWKKQKYDIGQADTLYEMGTNTLNDVPIVPISYTKGGDPIYDGWLIWDEGVEIWLIETAPKAIVEQ
ncbi:sigma-70 family RNA polymerase sigma factor [Sporosarcina sp. ANT_H38]|uniref:RNA polymerase sigma factor n=1 Tax=Sporosarcina sp. ANT_H38 TaxID=2597358 RepID=UPI0011F1A093|nr:sigma-70 family RNA polymerase sigma factor [Sporosarcina sp. ANT_H38]KAA0944011.1 sigma-70 family RNA polymerase sigma factor [Sporosarcina sp. ANT_H38]